SKMPPPRLLHAITIPFGKMGQCDWFVATKKEYLQMLGITKLHGCCRLY
uniref:Uncharacterized protein n=1 Tax=Parascaris univalens TaxID=6257 RepID=A0A915BMJ0_PARUN